MHNEIEHIKSLFSLPDVYLSDIWHRCIDALYIHGVSDVKVSILLLTWIQFYSIKSMINFIKRYANNMNYKQTYGDFAFLQGSLATCLSEYNKDISRFHYKIHGKRQRLRDKW